MHIADSRRLTGSNLQSANPCAVAEVRFTSGDDVERMLARWREALRALCAELGVDFGEPFGAPVASKLSELSLQSSLSAHQRRHATERKYE